MEEELLNYQQIIALDYLLEDEFTLFVEGPDDEEVLHRVLEKAGISDSKFIIYTADKLGHDREHLEDIGEIPPSGNCGKLILNAKLTDGEVARTRFIADRDLRLEGELADFGNLLWTDFPAIESYVVSVEYLDILSEWKFSHKLARSEGYIHSFLRFLNFLFFIRYDEKYDTSKFYAAVDLIDSLDSLNSFDFEKFCTDNELYFPNLLLEGDLRRYVYGHDVAIVFERMHRTQFEKNRKYIGTFKIKLLEEWMRFCFANSGLADKENLYKEILSIVR